MSSFLTREYKFESSMVQPKSDQHTMAMLNLKKLVKPLLRLMRKKRQVIRKTPADIQSQNEINSSLEDMRKDSVASCDNMANEQLEQRLINDLRQCPNNVAMIVQQGAEQHILPVHPEQSFIPVHFARTSSGTFFWTSADDVSSLKQQELKMREQYDRWVQA